MDIPKRQFSIKLLIFLKSNSHAKMAPDMLWRDLDCAPHPGQKVGCRLSTVTVHARSRRSTPTTFKPAPGDHVIDVFIAPCCCIPSQGASRPASSGASHPASLPPRANQTPP